ncbi:MAG TPA: CDP-glucose 4,6-dehydratase, partial [Phycisphaerae bacterium]|nr:CDP-glucose 4,6-dehydratase [Phycisphaerae bacterium]
MSRVFWKGKRVLLTGHTGFKGAWLSLWLESLGADVTGYALAPPTSPSLFQITEVAEGMRSLRGDVRDLERLTQALKDYRPQVVFHLAAQSLVRASYRDPVETYTTNILGTVNLLEAVRRTGGVRVVINVTSDKCYENDGRLTGYAEIAPMGGHDPYSSSKGCAELVTAAYCRSFFHADSLPAMDVAVASVRAGNVIGGGDWAEDRLVPDCMQALMGSQPIRIRNPDAVRPWQFVLEPLGGYLLLAERLWQSGADYVGAWNFGPAAADAKSVRWAVERLIQLWGEEASWVQDRGCHPHETRYLQLDC